MSGEAIQPDGNNQEEIEMNKGNRNFNFTLC